MELKVGGASRASKIRASRNPFNGIESRMQVAETMESDDPNPFNGIESRSRLSRPRSAVFPCRIHSMELKVIVFSEWASDYLGKNPFNGIERHPH